MELGTQDRVVLCRCWIPVYARHVVPDSRDKGVRDLSLSFWSRLNLLCAHTCRRSAAELDELFERKVRPWRFHKTETATQRLVQMSELKQ